MIDLVGCVIILPSSFCQTTDLLDSLPAGESRLHWCDRVVIFALFLHEGLIGAMKNLVGSLVLLLSLVVVGEAFAQVKDTPIAVKAVRGF